MKLPGCRITLLCGLLAPALLAQTALPPSLESDFRRAVEAQKAGDLDKAGALLRSILERGGNAAFVHNNLGIVYQTRGNHAAAEEQFRQAIVLDARYAAPRILLGASLLARGRAAEARVQLEAAVALEPRQPLARAELAQADDALGDAATAAEQWQAAASLEPGNPEYAYRLGADYMEVSRRAFARVIDERPRSARAWQIRGQTYLMSDKLEAARKAFTAAIAADASLPGNHLALAEISLRQGDRTTAAVEVEKELRRAPGNQAARAFKERLGSLP